MTDVEQRAAAKKFAEYWKDKGYEKGQSQPFWLSLLRDVFGVEHPEQYIFFEEQVHLDHTSFIDGTIPSTKVLIEQKGLGKNLDTPIKQSDGAFLTPFQQAKRYITELPVSQHPRWVITCNFEKFYIYDMEKPYCEPSVILLKDLPKEYYRLSFLVDKQNEHIKREMEVSIAAGEIVGVLYDALYKQYANPDSEKSQKSLNILCVRLVFCLYAEDAGIFGHHGMFHDYLSEFNTNHMRKALVEFFKVLDTPEDERDPYLSDDNPKLAAFPYVNGGLFADEDVEIPPFTDEIKELLLEKASNDFDWSEISPTIFGAVFESTLNPETRRSGGMHYTSIENIHKVIDPLFLDDLKAELNLIKETKAEKTKQRKLKDFQCKLSELIFLDPACGSGNFLTETYLSLRKLENEVISTLLHDQIAFDNTGVSPIMVSIKQFYGIEINDFAVTVAKTALWIAESQMMKKTEEIIVSTLDFLPLKSYTNIIEGNALQINWEDVVPKNQVNYIMGNPPFVGFTYMTVSQKADMQHLFPGVKNLDFVCAWYKKASDYITNTIIEVAFVSTNSIVQGETVSRFWNFMHGDIINFAYKTFIWSSEANDKAHVHCVIIGFSKFNKKNKYLYDNGKINKVLNINNYLIDGDNILVYSRNTPICDVPKMIYGNKPADGGNLIIEDIDKDSFIKNDPNSLNFIKPLLGSTEYINGKKRWCLWLVGVSTTELLKCPKIIERVQACKESREKSIASAIRKFANTPAVFAQITQPIDKDFVIVPRVSSQTRKYVPMGFIKSGTIVSDAVQIIPEATTYHFGILVSNVHMAWMRAVCGRLKSDYRYSKDIVYNNFPWPSPSPEEKSKIEKTAQAILDARDLYPDCTLADMYGEKMYLFPELLKAHQENDRAVMQAYGFDIKTTTESSCVAELMKMYQKLVEQTDKK